ncbi:MAG TPA: FkbM family methyltransferase [Candidatus Paceibacterota bacterium]|jgi:FkbM family methyltransferase|nr:FkbM family methyltransferase [Candidatus Paceibacterota bacterium]HRT55379.1 FkbM family methyltransferase [Candidatus Paceibacterota bacterium]
MHLIERLWNASPGSICRGLKRRWHERQVGSTWGTIQAGILAGAELYLPPAGPVWKEMIAGYYDNFLYEALQPRHPPAGKVVWDIGAHVGYHSLAFAALGAEVLAFEPNQANVERFELNVKRNAKLAPRIRHLVVAVSDTDGQMTFRQSGDLRGASMGGHLDRALPPLDPQAYEQARFKDVVVPTVRIDTLIESRGERPPDILKIDVEGAEELVLKGAMNLLKQRHPVLLIEVHHICLMFGIQKLLLDAGYTTRLLDQAHATPSRCFIMAEA